MSQQRLHGGIVFATGLSLTAGLLLTVAGCGGGAAPTTGGGAGAMPTGSGAAAAGTGGGGNYLDAISQARQKARELEAINNLKQLGIAFHNWHDTNGSFPIQTGTPGSKLSWRVAILPFIEEQSLYQQFKLDEPWDSPNNKKLLDRMPNLYRDPRFQTKDEKPTVTYFQGVTGVGGVLNDPKGLTLTKITSANGTSNTLMVVEAGTPVPWTKPDDYEHDPQKPLPPLGGPKKSPTFLAVFCDGHVQAVPTNLDEKTLRCMLRWDNTTAFKLP